MTHNDTKWTADGRTFPDIEPHTKTKHLLTEQYVTDLIHTLYGQPYPHGINTFTFIDGFCGGGIYRDPKTSDCWYGSPIRLIRAVREGYLKSQRTHPLNVKYIFIDSNKNHLNCLKNHAMSEAGLENLSNEQAHVFESHFGQLIEQCEFICDEFENKINYCVYSAGHRKGHSLFFLDPFGWSDVSMESFRKITSLKKSEIIYTFMIDYIHRFVFNKEGKERETFEKLLETQNYFDLQHLKRLDQFGEQAFYRNELMRLFRDRGKANKLMTFSVIPKNNHQVLYYLLHISSHLRALEVMKDGSWSYNNLDYQYHYDIYGYGFRTASYYQDNQLELTLNITLDSETTCIEKLDNNLESLIKYNGDGVKFSELCHKTMELNPATKKHYCEYLFMLRDAKEIEVLTYNKKAKKYQITQKNNLVNNDIIRPSQERRLFSLRPFIKR